MSISTTTRKAGPYVGNDAAASFTFAFKVFTATDVLVVRAAVATGAETTMTLASDYTVTLNADQDVSPGGSVTLTAGPLSSAYTLTLASQIAETQPAVFTNTGGFYPAVLNTSLDRLTAMVQQLSEKVSRAVKVPISSAATATVDYLLTLLNSAVDAAGQAAIDAESARGQAVTAASQAEDSAEIASGAANNTILRDGSRSMTGPLLLAGNAASPLQAVPKQQVDQAFPTGWIAAMARLVAPPGWLLVDGKTIGNPTSGATARANADTAALFAELWSFPATSVPIYDSVGATSVRGASAAADFAASKRLPLFTPDGGAFMRMWVPGQTVDPGRVAGSSQAAAAGSFTVSADQDDGDAGGGSFRSVTNIAFNGVTIVGNGAGTGTVTVAPGDTRPYNLAIPHYIKM